LTMISFPLYPFQHLLPIGPSRPFCLFSPLFFSFHACSTVMRLPHRSFLFIAHPGTPPLSLAFFWMDPRPVALTDFSSFQTAPLRLHLPPPVPFSACFRPPFPLFLQVRTFRSFPVEPGLVPPYFSFFWRFFLFFLPSFWLSAFGLLVLSLQSFWTLAFSKISPPPYVLPDSPLFFCDFLFLASPDLSLAILCDQPWA